MIVKIKNLAGEDVEIDDTLCETFICNHAECKNKRDLPMSDLGGIQIQKVKGPLLHRIEFFCTSCAREGKVGGNWDMQVRRGDVMPALEPFLSVLQQLADPEDPEIGMSVSLEFE